MHIYGNTAAVIHDLDGVVLLYCDFDVGGIAGEGFVNTVVNHLVNQVMEAAAGDVADIHGRAFAHSLQAFEHLDIIGSIFFSSSMWGYD